MFKNVGSQKIQVFAFTPADGLPKTGDAANITVYVSKDHGSVTALGDTSATEMDATNAPGIYVFDLTQGETNADELTFSGKSSTSGVKIVQRFISTLPNRFSSLVIDSAGLADANMVKMGPTGSGTAQTARDIGASVLLSSGTGTGQLNITSGVVDANATKMSGTALTGRDIGASVLLSSGTGTGQLSITSGVVSANVTQLNGDTTAAANIAKTTRAIARCTVTGSPTTTSIPTSACAPSGAVADQFKGRIITFDADTATTALRGQSTDITANTSSATPTFTCTALTTAPASGDTFSIT